MISEVMALGFARKPTNGNKLDDVRECLVKIPLNNMEIPALLFPPTSVMYGIGRLKNLYGQRDSSDSILGIIYYTLTGLLCTMGLGAVLVVLKITICAIGLVAQLIDGLLKIIINCSSCCCCCFIKYPVHIIRIPFYLISKLILAIDDDVAEIE